MAIDQQIQIAIEIYIREGLPPEAEDKLWELFLSNPTYFAHFITLLNLVELQKKPPRADKEYFV